MDLLELLTISDPLGGRLFKATTSSGIDSLDAYTLSDPAGGRRIKVSVTSASGGSGLFLDGGIMSSTLRNVEDAAGTNSPLQLSTSQVAIGATGVSPYLGFISSITGSAISAITQQPSGSGMAWEGNNFNFRSNAVGFFVGGGSSFITPTARLHVRGDGTNNTSLFETSSGSPIFRIATGNAATSQIIIGNGLNLYSRLIDGETAVASSVTGLYAGYQSGHQNDWAVSSHYFTSPNRVFNNAAVVTGTAGIARFVQTFAIQNSNSSAINYRPLAVEYTINNTVSSSGTATGIFLNAIETSLNGMAHSLIDLQIGGSSRFSVNSSWTFLNGTIGATIPVSRVLAWGGNSGNTAISGSGSASGSASFISIRVGDGSAIYKFRGDGFLEFGDSTVGAPALKRTGATLEVRLANDSGPANLVANTFNCGSVLSSSSLYINSSGNTNLKLMSFGTTGDENVLSVPTVTNSSTTGQKTMVNGSFGFAPTSGTATLASFVVSHTINQTGGANGITRGLWVNPTLTSAPDWRGIESSGTYNNTTGTLRNVFITPSFAAAAGSASFRPLEINYTINNSGAQTSTGPGTATATGIFLNATETNLNGMSHNFLDFQVSNTSRFSVNNVGGVTALGTISTTSGNLLMGGTGVLVWNGRSRILSSTGSPEGVVTANQGSLYLRTDGGANTTLYVKESGTGNTGWVAK